MVQKELNYVTYSLQKKLDVVVKCVRK